MEDLVPLLIFIVIAAVNFIKYLAEKGNKPPAKTPEKQPAEPREHEPSPLEEFFSDLAEKFEPKPHELPAWPKGIERPDYVQEVDAYETAEAEPLFEDLPAEPDAPAMPVVEPVRVAAAKVETASAGLGHASMTFRLKSLDTALGGMSGSRVSLPLLRSGGGRTHFDLKTRKQLKQALMAGMVFGSPRAYDNSFYNTMAK